MKNVVALLMCLYTTSCHGIDRKAAHEFEQVVKKGVCVLSSFPEEIRARRSGSMEQNITVSDDGVLSLSFSFPCRPFSEDERNAKNLLVKSNKQFLLQDFKAGDTKHYEANKLLNTLSFFDHNVAWMIAFRSSSDFDHAATSLEKLIQSCKERVIPHKKPSEIARENGFQFLVFAPRAASIDDELRLLKTPIQSSSLVCWLTKSDSTTTEKVLEESCGALPLFFYDLDILDNGLFYTVSSPGMTSFCQYDLNNECVQSVYSDDGGNLGAYFGRATYCGIHFEKMPSLSTPKALITDGSEKKMLSKTKARGIHVDAAQIIQVPFDLSPSEKVQDCFPCLLHPLNSNSIGILRFILLRGRVTRESLKVVMREFPELSSLLKMKSHYRKDLSLEECLLMRLKTLYSIEGQLSPFAQKVLRVACMSSEFGAPFGTDEELFYNTWPFALSIAEMVGFSENEKLALSALLRTQPIPDIKMKEEKLLTAFLSESLQADEIGISLGEWLSLRQSYDCILARQFRTVPESVSAPLKKLKKFSNQYKMIVPFGIPLGKFVFKSSLPTRNLFSAYIWEVRDAKHREGLPLKKCRDKFEKMMLEKPKSPWKGRFFAWVDKECDRVRAFPDTYLETEAARAPYLASFQDRILVSPSFPQETEVELLFVIDARGRVFVGQEKRAQGEDRPGFSHASFFAGGPVAAAGKLVVRGGHIIRCTIGSDFYPSGPQEEKLAADVLGVVTSG